ncbi:MAG: molybdenum cofactor biosynthesis protein MoaE [Nevskia sp.]|nr:molybdenum cofactor biosynthesis protein MoaE [Nevskia sp.]
MSTSRLRQGPLNLSEWVAAPMPPHCGGLAFFAGTVRNVHEGRAVSGIKYHAHVALAERRLAEIEAEAAARFGAEVSVAHAVGDLAVGDASVVVVARAGHRAEAFAACRWAIDTLKQTVPIWKEERYADGETRFQEGTPIKDIKNT